MGRRAKIVEFKDKCERTPQLVSEWRAVVIAALYARLEQYNRALKALGGEQITQVDCRTLRRYRMNFKQAWGLLGFACDALGVIRPPMTTDEICALYK